MATIKKAVRSSSTKEVTKKTSTIPTTPIKSREIAPKKAAPKKTIEQKKVSKPALLSDDDIDIELFDREHNVHIPLEKKRITRGVVEAKISACPQGKQRKVTRDNPRMLPPLNTANYITQLHVTLSAQNLKVTWLDGTIENWLCSPNPILTPKLNDVVGFKCGVKHTNMKKDGMAWFTAFKSKGMAYGFHNSQRVGIGVVSHGCVRVSCEHAKTINQHSWSGKTKIKIVR